ncbi:MAG: Gfo/Idh/MocA family oxidoreductase [Pelagibacteraceae bacterium]|jgi:predicted dehydrogenase|nr:Gfo/Idh/MocA family oxidoreductase [Pelagibacteraceae bacterium]MBO6468500.1 Gfo/Idh/MocA family oxidoreductase [Pelagibacteraceae bacterium]MBO6478388.1 Gfo/Idh/MocA family oxidoreductase [Pelagibacteraceae bacterium]MDP6784116.1 Gfo/Idh/MocA family oxidoreductase [Alphaproteobacteria bacterium]HJL57780.1 Gfo/Idh/MocA family oxidoreductase [Alphaproteobacteria bacterium]|tara:strand:- start:1250 stop:2386 length:1137 start_codon:yes stop_codon:yes gene_type:complete
MTRLKLGMIGGGQGAFIGAVHRIASRIDDRYELIAGCLSSTEDKALASAKEIGIAPDRSYSDFTTMAKAEALREDGIEVVSIVTPNHMHAQPAIEFLKKGIHVICDKPMTATLDEAQELYNIVKNSEAHFFLTHNYSGYPVVREMRRLVKEGSIGKIRVVKGSYLQGWLAKKEEDNGLKQAEWRTDPSRSGVAGAVGDIGSHTMHLLEFVTNHKLESLAADLSIFVSGRRLDDDASILIRMNNNVRGSLWISQVAVGEENNFKISIYGEKGALHWAQENPNYATLSTHGELDKIITRGGPIHKDSSMANVRIPPGHPEGYLEGFAQIYTDVADVIQESDKATQLLDVLPNADDGLHIMKFINASVQSSNNNSEWVKIN